MLRVAQAIVLALALLLAATNPSAADHMNGQYRGTGQVEGTSLSLQQSGTQIRGQLSGASTGTLQGQTDGGDNFQGTADITGDGQYQIVGRWSREGLTLTLRSGQGEGTVVFVPATGGTQPGGQRPGGTPPQQPETEPSGQIPVGGETGETGTRVVPPLQNGTAPFFVSQNGVQTGPMPIEQVQAEILAGTITRETLVWQPGQPQWEKAGNLPALTAMFPPEMPKADAYYVAVDGVQTGPLTIEDILARIAAGTTGPGDFMWKSGMQSWTAAGSFTELADAFARAAETPPALPGANEQPPELPAEAGETPPDLPGSTGGQVPEPQQTAPAAGGSGAMPLIEQQVDEILPGADPTARQAAIDCMAEAFSPMSPADAERIGDLATPLTDQERKRFTESYPDIEENAMLCLASQTDLGPDESSSSVSIPDGRSLIVVGGSNQSLLPMENGGYRITLDGTEIVFSDGAISVAGVPREMPRFKRNLEIRLKDGEIVLTPDVR